MRVAITQPDFCPSTARFAHMAQVDLWVHYDDVPMSKGDADNWLVQNWFLNNGKGIRRSVHTRNEHDHLIRLNKVRVIYEVDWQSDWRGPFLKGIEQNYSNEVVRNSSPVFDSLRRILFSKPQYLADLNIEIIEAMANLAVTTPKLGFKRSSEFNLDWVQDEHRKSVEKSKRLVALLEKLRKPGTEIEYVANQGSNYLREPDNAKLFEDSGIGLSFFEYPPIPKGFKDASIIHVLLKGGDPRKAEPCLLSQS